MGSGPSGMGGSKVAEPRAERGLGERPQLSDEVAADIRQGIMSGRLRQGEYLRLERLAVEFGISVTPVREALQSLRSEGFVALEPRRGFVVAGLSRQDVKDLFWVLAVIGAELTARAADQMPEEILKELTELHTGLERAVAAKRPDLVEERARDFHRTLNQAAGSEKLTWTYRAVARYVPRGLLVEIAEWPAVCLSDHRRILDGLRGGTRHAASGAMRVHLGYAGDLLVSHLEDRGVWAP